MVMKTKRKSSRIAKSYVWVWVSAAVIVLVGLGLVGAYTVIKNGALQTSSAYQASLRSYTADVYDAATIAASDPESVEQSVSAIRPPSLPDALLGNWFDEYVSAKSNQLQTSLKLSELTDELKRYATFYTFYNDYLFAYSELEAYDEQGSSAVRSGDKSRVIVYLRAFGAKLNDIASMLRTAKIPESQRSSTEALAALYEALEVHWTALSQGYIDDDSAAYNSAYDSYVDASDQISGVEKPLQEYFNALTSNTKQAAKKFQTYSDSIK
jgi:hypothetical protein